MLNLSIDSSQLLFIHALSKNQTANFSHELVFVIVVLRHKVAMGIDVVLTTDWVLFPRDTITRFVAGVPGKGETRKWRP